MSTNIFTPTPFMPATMPPGIPGNTPMMPTMPGMPNPQQMQAIQELANMFQNGQNPLEELRTLREKVTGLEKQIAEKSTQEIGSIEKQLLNTPKGAAYLDIRRDGIMEILTRHALRNPDTAAETKAFLDGWHGKATEYLKGLTTEKTE